MIVRPHIFNSDRVVAAQSTRLGGVSSAPFDSMNLGLSVKDDEKNVMANRKLFFGGLGIDPKQVALTHQVHGNKVLVVSEPGRKEGFDAQITNIPGVFLAVSVADCTPILVHDEKNNAVAAIHAGWRGTVGCIVRNTLNMMYERYGTKGENCRAFIGACISVDHFEVGNEVAEHFHVSLKRFDVKKGKWFVDLKKANQQQLIDFGIPPGNIEVSEYCTVENNNTFFSHRKEKGVTGRMMAVIGIR